MVLCLGFFSSCSQHQENLFTLQTDNYFQNVHLKTVRPLIHVFILRTVWTEIKSEDAFQFTAEGGTVLMSHV